LLSPPQPGFPYKSARLFMFVHRNTLRRKLPIQECSPFQSLFHDIQPWTIFAPSLLPAIADLPGASYDEPAITELRDRTAPRLVLFFFLLLFTHGPDGVRTHARVAVWILTCGTLLYMGQPRNHLFPLCLFSFPSEAPSIFNCVRPNYFSPLAFTSRYCKRSIPVATTPFSRPASAFPVSPSFFFSGKRLLGIFLKRYLSITDTNHLSLEAFHPLWER